MSVDLPSHVPPQAIPQDHREQEFLPGPVAMWQLKKSLLIEEKVFVHEGVPMKQVVLRTPMARFVPIGPERATTFGHSDEPFGLAMQALVPADAKRSEIAAQVQALRTAIKPLLRELARLYVVAQPPDPSARLFG